MSVYQRVWAEINLDTIKNNIQEVKKRMGSRSVMAIVKADAYGHGAVPVSKTLLENGADSLGVAIFEEGLQLREHHISAPILILGYTPEPGLAGVIENNLTQTVYEYGTAKKLSDIAVKINKTAEIHIKIDTGMSRLGFFPTDETVTEIKKIIELPNIAVKGIYTHLAVSDVGDRDFTGRQVEKFSSFMEKLRCEGIDIPCKHISNSGAVINFPEIHTDAVRAGIILYGLRPAVEIPLDDSFHPAMSLKSGISHVKAVQKGTSIGYGRTHFTNRDSVIGTIPVGYADGYLRGMGNCGRVLVSGQYAPIVGNICMDQFMIDVTEIQNVQPGDEVVLFGRQGENEITIDEVAKLRKTIDYEVVCTVSKRVPRIYIGNNKIINP